MGLIIFLVTRPEVSRVSYRLWLILACSCCVLELFPESPCGLSSYGFWPRGLGCQCRILLIRETKASGGRWCLHSQAGFFEALCLPETTDTEGLLEHVTIFLGSTARCLLPAAARAPEGNTSAAAKGWQGDR